MSTVVLTCLKCGNQFRPGAPPLSGKDLAILAVIVLVLWIIFGR
jgi:hypothetical protein